VLLAKSYSRFGRNQRETLTALAELFEHGIRIIFVEDGLDSLRDKGQFGLFAWLAEQEARKISERIKTTWQLYNKQGKIHSTRPTYGYEYNRSIRNFEVNEKEAGVVREIFEMYVRGGSYRGIANYLNGGGIPTKIKGKWGSKAISDIVVNDFYLGVLTLGKQRTVDVTIKKLENVDRGEWYIHKNNHPAIVSEELFQKAQDEHSKRKKNLSGEKSMRHSTKHLFSNITKCGICGASATSHRASSDRKMAYVCSAYQNWGAKGGGHKRNGILEEILICHVRAGLEILAKDNFKKTRDFFAQKTANSLQQKAKLSIASLDEKIEEQTKLSLSLLNAFSEGILGKNQFKLQNAVIEEKLSSLMQQREERIFEQNKIIVPVDKQAETIKDIKTMLETDTTLWTNKMLKTVIQKIILEVPQNEVTIFYNYSI